MEILENQLDNLILNCPHIDIIEEDKVTICLSCGEEIHRNIEYDKEWRYYGSGDNKHHTDPNRCQSRKLDSKNIFKDVSNMGFNDKIVNKANEIYEQVTDDKIYRGNSRKAIIFACIFHAYKILEQPKSCSSLIKAFELSKKNGLYGLRHVHVNAPKDSEVRIVYITPKDLILEIMSNYDATQEQKDDIVKIYDCIKNRSIMLNRSRPQSIAAGLTYYYILKTNRKIDLIDFKKKVDLSELTILKIVKEIQRLIP